jgi:hypothetical protein
MAHATLHTQAHWPTHLHTWSTCRCATPIAQSRAHSNPVFRHGTCHGPDAVRARPFLDALDAFEPPDRATRHSLRPTCAKLLAPRVFIFTVDQSMSSMKLVPTVETNQERTWHISHNEPTNRVRASLLYLRFLAPSPWNEPMNSEVRAPKACPRKGEERNGGRWTRTKRRIRISQSLSTHLSMFAGCR